MIRRLALAAILVAGPAAAQQTNSAGPVSQMQNASTPLSGSELLYIVQGGQSKKITVGGLTFSQTLTIGSTPISGGTPNDCLTINSSFLAANACLFAGGPLGTPSSGTLTNASGLPISGVSGWGANVQNALSQALNGANGLLGYGAPATALLYTPLGTGALQLTLAQWANNWFVNVMDYCSPTQVQNDITTCAGNALTYLESVGTTSYGRGELFFPAQYSPYHILGTLDVTASDINLVGEGPDASYLECSSATQNCVQIGQSSGTQIHNSGIRNLSVNESASTTGDNVQVINASQTVLERVNEQDCYVCVEVTQNANTTTIRNSSLYAQQAAAFAGVYFHDVATGATRSDTLNLDNVTIAGNYGQGSGIIQDGQASTVNMVNVVTVDFVHGWWVKNSAESATYYPSFSNIFSFLPQANSAEAVEIDAGSAWIISDSVIVNGPGAGSTTAHCAVLINPDTGYSNTNDVQISNSRIGNAGECGVNDGAKFTHLSNIVFTGIGLMTANTYSSIQTQTTTLGAQYNHITGDCCGTNSQYTINVTPTAGNPLYISMLDIDGTNAGTATINDTDAVNEDLECMIIPKGGGVATCGIGGNPSIEGGQFSVRKDQNGLTVNTLHNNYQGANAEAAYSVSAGGANNYTYFGQTNVSWTGALPASGFFVQPGPGALSLELDGSLANSGAGVPVTVNPYLRVLQVYSASGTAIPACGSTLKGAIAQVSDGSSTYGATYAGGGIVSTLVMCNGTAWITH